MLLSSISLALTRLGQRLGRWSPLALWPDGIATPGMWISPRDLTSQWADYTGTTPVSVPGTVADSSNPVGLALDIRAGAPEVLGPELVTNGDFSGGTTGWSAVNSATISTVGGELQVVSGAVGYPGASQVITWTEGHTYEVTATARQGTTTDNVRIVLPSVVALEYTSSSPVTKSAIVVAVGSSVTAYCEIFNPFDITPGETAYFDNISVREVPGNHMLQSTSTSRPLLSARVNLLTYTEDFSSVWVKSACTTPASALTPPAGYAGAVKYIKNSGGGLSEIYRYRPCEADSNWSITAKKEEWRYLVMYVSVPFGICYFDLEDGVIASETSGLNASIVSEGDGWYRCSIPHEYIGVSLVSFFGTTSDGQLYPTGDGTSGISVTGAQVSYGLDVAPYQPILTDGSTYPATGFPIAQLYDGVDDGMATAAFAAGTLINGMDCMIVVRRDSAAAYVTGLYKKPEGGEWFGAVESGSGSVCFSNSGSPTVWVDGLQLAGGTAVTKGTLDTALTVGDYHIMEFRGLDLSTWVSCAFGGYSGFLFPGTRGDILLYPSTASTTDKDAARQWLADYYGVTLP